MTRSHLSRREVLRGAGLITAGAAVAAAGVKPAFGESKHGPRTTCYVEVNNHSIANVGKYELASTGANVFDIGLIFASNINYDVERERAYLYHNPNVQAQLDNAGSLIRPLQQKGIKVMLSILGNHQGAGFANFPDYAAADAFAEQLAEAVQTYGLDGIDFDDEYTEYGKNGTGQPNDWSFVYLCQALRERLPDKLISLYFIGPASEHLSHGGVDVADLIDFSVNPYYGAYWDSVQVPGLSKDEWGAAAINITATGADRARELAIRTRHDGFGYFTSYNLPSTDVSSYLSSFTTVMHNSPVVYTG